ncbi:hypothetical protein [Rhodococcus opacus]|nr:hypothetical protein [Rhodococcus opacus]
MKRPTRQGVPSSMFDAVPVPGQDGVVLGGGPTSTSGTRLSGDRRD